MRPLFSCFIIAIVLVGESAADGTKEHLLRKISDLFFSNREAEFALEKSLGTDTHHHTLRHPNPEDSTKRIDKIRSLVGQQTCEIEIRIDFSTAGDGTPLNHGDYVSEEWLDKYGMTVAAQSVNGGYTPDGKARIFDTTVESSQDPDLNSPNQRCKNHPGPGIGAGGAPGQPGENCNPHGEGNLLIVQQSNDPTPNDYAYGGTISFTFEKPTYVKSIGLMDVEQGPGTLIVLRKPDGSTEAREVKGLGDNSIQEATIAEVVGSISVAASNSFGVRYIEFCVDNFHKKILKDPPDNLEFSVFASNLSIELGSEVSFKPYLALPSSSSTTSEQVTIMNIIDLVSFEELDGNGSCEFPHTINAGEEYSCAIQRTVEGTLGSRDFGFLAFLVHSSGTPFVEIAKTSISIYQSLLAIPASGGDLTGFELWSSDGTKRGTQIVSDLYPGPGNSRPMAFGIFKDQLFFSADNGANGRELWMSDGTHEGTMMVKDINLGPESSDPVALTVFKDKLYFAAVSSGGIDRQLWVSDGTEQGTVFFSDKVSPLSMTVAGDKLFIIDRGGVWVTDGIEMENLVDTGDVVSTATMNDKLFFSRRIEDQQSRVLWELWVSDGTTLGTMRLRTFNPGSNQRCPTAWLTPFKDRIYFSACEIRRELWVSDGTEQGTFQFSDMTKDILTGPGFQSDLTVSGDKLFFIGDDGISGRELWVTPGLGSEPGSPPIVEIVRDINPGFTSSDPSNLVALDGKVYFYALRPDAGLFVSDGTEVGTKMLKKVRPQRLLEDAAALKNKLYFSCEATNFTGRELWETDGTEGGTMMVKDIFPGFASGMEGLERMVVFPKLTG